MRLKSANHCNTLQANAITFLHTCTATVTKNLLIKLKLNNFFFI
ncbi:unnamed protein product [Tenebrio molitor]|nr:unnamed protein product [Tenebrio molitor]